MTVDATGVSAVTETPDLPVNPFPGIEPFDFAHSALLYRRDTEKRMLFRQMVMYRGVLLYGDQGVGKSSLVNAGLMPMAIKDGYQPHRVRVQPTPGFELVVSPPPAGPGSLEWLSTRAAGSAGRPIAVSPADLLSRAADYEDDNPLLLIFDQFEEWITLFGKSPGLDPEKVTASQEAIRQVIVRLLKDSALHVKVVLSFREDYLAGLDPIFDEAPNLPDQYVRLLPLDNSQLTDSIVGPFEQYDEVYVPPITRQLAQRIVADLDKEAPRRRVEAAEVQIVCHDLFKKRLATGATFEQTYEDLRTAKGILDAYFESKLRAIAEDRRDGAVALLSRLVHDKHRNVLPRDILLDLVELDDKLDRTLLEHALADLMDQGLINIDERENVAYVEITSEFLIGWIDSQAARRRERQALDQLAHEFEVTRKRRRRWGFVLAIPIALLIANLGFQVGSPNPPPLAEIDSITIVGFDDVDTERLYDGDEEEPVKIPVGEEKKFKVEVVFAEELDIIDVSVVSGDSFEPKAVFISSTKIEVPIGEETPEDGRGAYGRTEELTLVVEAREIDPEVWINELKFWHHRIGES